MEYLSYLKINAELINEMHCMCSVKVGPSPADLQFTLVFVLVDPQGFYQAILED